MKHSLLVALLAACLAPLSLKAEDEILKNDLKSVMMHLDKTQKESNQKIEELETANKELKTTNFELNTMVKDLSSSNIQLAKQLTQLRSEIESLQEANALLEQKLSDMPVREVQTASLASSTTVAINTPTPAPQRITPADLENSTASKPQSTERFGPDVEEVSFNEVEKTPTPEPVVRNESTLTEAPTVELGQPIPDFSLSGARRNNAIATEHLSDGTVLLVNINTATARELRLIPGVGPALADKIINHRPYSGLWDLMRVEGISKKRVESLAPYVTTE